MAKPTVPRQNNKPSPGLQKLVAAKRARRLKFIRLNPGSALNPKVITDPENGKQYANRNEMHAARKLRRTQILTQFSELLADSTLGQDPWEQLPGEPVLQFTRFRMYRDMWREGSRIPRSVQQIANQLSAEVNYDRLRKIASKWHWTLRAQCWDRHLAQLADEEFRNQKLASARKQANLGRKLQEAALKGAENILAIGGVDLDANSVARLADVGVKIERLANGDSTSNEARQTETRLIWDGPQPKWAKHDVTIVAADQVESGPLTTAVNRLPPPPAPTFADAFPVDEEEVAE